MKILMILAGMIGGFFLPWEAVATPWMIIGLIASLVFILIQLILIVDCAHAINMHFLEKNDEVNHKQWHFCKYR